MAGGGLDVPTDNVLVVYQREGDDSSLSEANSKSANEKLLKKLEQDVRSSVRQVFDTLCGQSDKEDHLTGMQRDMELSLQQLIQPAFYAGKQAGDRAVIREELRWKKQLERQREEQKRQGDMIRKRVEESVKDRVMCMAEEMASQIELFKRSMDAFREAKGKLESDLADASNSLAKAHERVATLEAMLAEERQGRVDAESRMTSLSQQVNELKAELTSAQASAKDAYNKAADNAASSMVADMRQRWSDDVARVEKQLQSEISARVAAADREKTALERLAEIERTLPDRAAREEEEARNSEYCKKLQAKVAKLERQRTEDNRVHAAQMTAAEEALAAERDARAFAETVSQRLENELMIQSRHLLKKMGMNQSQSLRSKLSRHSQNMEFQDFSGALEKLVGGGAGPSKTDSLPPMKANIGTSHHTAAPQPPPNPKPTGSTTTTTTTTTTTLTAATGTMQGSGSATRLNLARVPSGADLVGLDAGVGGSGGMGGAVTERGSRHARAVQRALNTAR